ncbi:MAG TPA: hypothetical protein VGH80_07105 [Xanthomonadaceae bacterium]|jgi:hypothetical protein
MESRLERFTLAKGWKDFTSNQQPEYFVTLTYRSPWGDGAAERGLKFFVKALVKSMPRRTINNIGGVVAAERTVKSVEFDGSYHFHIVLWGVNESMPDAAEWLQEAVVTTAIRMKSPTGAQMCHWRSVNFQCIEKDDLDLVACYETKDIYKFERPAGAQMLFIKGHDVIGTVNTQGDYHAT